MIYKNQKKGQIALLNAELRATKKEYIVSSPSEGNRYDLVIDDGKKLIRAQIKYLDCYDSRDKHCLLLKLHKKNTKCYTKFEIDCLIVYLPEFNELLYFNPEIFHNKSFLRINLRNQKSKYYYKNFIW